MRYLFNAMLLANRQRFFFFFAASEVSIESFVNFAFEISDKLEKFQQITFFDDSLSWKLLGNERGKYWEDFHE